MNFSTITKGRPASSPAFFLAPVAGWNNKDPLASMQPQFARELVNFFPEPGKVTLRKGYETWRNCGASTGLLVWQGASSSKLFASTADGFVDVSSRYGSSSVVHTAPRATWHSANVHTDGGDFLVVAGAAGIPRIFDGTSWELYTTSTFPQLTGEALEALCYVALMKNRLWFLKRNSTEVFYLDAGAVSGTLHKLSMGHIFRRGGKIVGMYPWTTEADEGPVEFVLFMTDQGELAIFKGMDPENISTFSLAGVYFVGKPLGEQHFVKFGADAALLTEHGLFSVSKAFRNNTIDFSKAFSYTIKQSFQEAVISYRHLSGWGVYTYPALGMVFVNIPTSPSTAKQFVMNTITGAWSCFEGWNFKELETFNNQLYATSDTGVELVWSTYTDKGAPITATCRQAFSAFGAQGTLKHLTSIQPIFQIDGEVTVHLGLDTDYLQLSQGSKVTVSSAIGALWDEAEWDEDYWGEDFITRQPICTVPSRPFYSAGIVLQVTSAGAMLSWAGTNLLIQTGGFQ